MLIADTDSCLSYVVMLMTVLVLEMSLEGSLWSLSGDSWCSASCFCARSNAAEYQLSPARLRCESEKLHLCHV